MTITKHPACSIALDTKPKFQPWCVYEHHVVMSEGEPPQVILIQACPLADVFRMAGGKTNSEWARIFANGGQVLLQIVATTDNKQEAYMLAQERVRDTKPTPICNLKGHNLKSAQRAILCIQNGQRYNTQQEAATDLGIHASAISRHMNGHIDHAQGFTFAYAPSDMDGGAT